MKTYLYILLLVLFALVACTRPDDDECIEDILERLENLESVTDELQKKKDDGFLIKEVIRITEGDGGWHIVFTDGSSIDIMNGVKGDPGDPGDKGDPGAIGATIQIDVRRNVDNSITLWLNDGAGWRNTGIDLTGGQGANGVTPKLEVRENIDSTITVWYNVTAGYPTEGWVDTGKDLTGKVGAPGSGGIIPKLEVRNNGNGTITIWYNTTENYPDSGWVNTNIDLTGPIGDSGTPGVGTDGVSPKIDLRYNDDGTLTVWYNVTKDYPDSGWVNTDVDLTPPSAVSSTVFSMIDNEAEGTVTLILTDGMNLVQYAFEKASTAIRFEVMNTARVDILEGTTGEIRFRVNPSTAWIPTGTKLDDGLAKWTLDRFDTRPKAGTRASYVNPATHFELQSILKDGDKDGQYVATIKDIQGDPNYEYIMTLVLNTNSTANPILISSGPFTLGAIKPTLIDVPDGSALVDVTGGGEAPTNAYTYVGAFWKYDQTGERVIKINVGTASGNLGAWKAEVAWYDTKWNPANGDGVVIVAGPSFDSNIYTASPGDAEAHQITTDGTNSVTGTVAANGDILFRIGLTKTFDAYHADNNPARYAVVLLSYGDLAKKQKLFLRQGEGNDYLMHKDDADQGGGRVRSKAIKFSPYNLTAAELNDNEDYESLVTNGGVFASYPTQAGALFQFSSDTNPRYAYHPTKGGKTTSPNLWEDNNSPVDWSVDQETCPTGYRRPVGGSQRSSSEFAQSLMADLTNKSTDNSVWGYYADGYFDRHAIGTQDADYIGTPSDTPSTVAKNTKDVAYIGRLFYNPVATGSGGHYNSSLFFCASGARDKSTGILYNAGTNGHYWSSSESGAINAYCPGLSNDTPAATAAMERSLGYSVRCVKQ